VTGNDGVTISFSSVPWMALVTLQVRWAPASVPPGIYQRSSGLYAAHGCWKEGWVLWAVIEPAKELYSEVYGVGIG